MIDRRWVMALAALIAACGSKTETSSGATSGASTGAASTGAGATGSTSSGGACMPMLGMSPAGCPTTSKAEDAFGKVQSTCGIGAGDIDASDMKSPKLNASGKTKACATCACRQAIYDYQTQYQNCTASDQANAAFAKNMYLDAQAC